MKIPHRTDRLGALVAFVVLIAAVGTGQAQPTTIRMVVPYPAGGITDSAARIISEKMSHLLGQTIVVDNRPGAGGRIGIDAVVKATADGSVLLFTNSSYSILPVIDPKVPYDPVKSLAPVAMVATYGLGLVVGNHIPASNITELIAYAKKNPGKLSYGSSGPGSGVHFAGEQFKSLTGTYMVHIPYRSTTAALNDVAAGLVDLTFDGSAKPMVDAGKVKLLAVTDDKRDPRFPNVPTVVQAGLPGYVQQSWAGILVPAATPPAIIDRLNRAASEALAEPDVRKRFQDMGLQPQGGAPTRLGEKIHSELVLYRKIAADIHLKFD